MTPTYRAAHLAAPIALSTRVVADRRQATSLVSVLICEAGGALSHAVVARDMAPLPTDEAAREAYPQ